MLNKYIRSSIIVTLQVILPVVLLLLSAPFFLKFSNEFNQVQVFFRNHQIGFLIAHSIFYLILFWIWPKLIKLYCSKHEVSAELIQLAMQAKWYLLGIMAFFEMLAWWR